MKLDQRQLAPFIPALADDSPALIDMSGNQLRAHTALAWAEIEAGGAVRLLRYRPLRCVGWLVGDCPAGVTPAARVSIGMLSERLSAEIERARAGEVIAVYVGGSHARGRNPRPPGTVVAYLVGPEAGPKCYRNLALPVWGTSRWPPASGSGNPGARSVTNTAHLTHGTGANSARGSSGGC